MTPVIRLRRTTPEPRFELIPLLDVIFLVLTFFIYAMVLMVPIELLPVPLQRFIAGERAEPAPAISLTITRSGELFLNRDPVQMVDILPRLEEAKAEDPRTAIYLVLEAGEGTVDRGPLLTELWDRLKDAGMDIRLVGRPDGSPPPHPAPPPGDG